MKYFAFILAAAIALPVQADEPKVTVALVQHYQARIPNCERACTGQGAFATAGHALEIARAIARVARTPHEAAQLALYAAWESGNDPRAVGDAGRALGAWQLHYGPGLDLDASARYWLAAAEASRKLCARLPERERLAALVSGSCDRGRIKAGHREDIIAEMMAE